MASSYPAPGLFQQQVLIVTLKVQKSLQILYIVLYPYCLANWLTGFYLSAQGWYCLKLNCVTIDLRMLAPTVEDLHMSQLVYNPVPACWYLCSMRQS